MRIGIDIDDTITNTTTKLNEYFEKFGFDKKNDDFCNYSDEQLETYRELLEKYIDLVLDECIVKDKCVNVIDELKSKGNEIYIITARSNRYSKNVYEITVNYLRRNNIKFDKIFFGFENKKDICLSNKIDYMIDDNINVYSSLVETSTKPILFGKDLNKEFDCERVNDWEEVLEIIN